MNNIKSTLLTNSVYKNNQKIKSVDLDFVEWSNNQMSRAFYQCSNLISVSNINENVTNMYGTFGYCYNLVNTPIIPNGVTDMSCSFSSCSNLVNAPVIPNSVVNMSETFYSCSNLVNAPVIPNGVTNIDRMFVTCSNLVNAPVIPNSVTSMIQTFIGCFNIVNAYVIGNSVTNMYSSFSSCRNLIGNIYIQSENIANAYDCFYGTSLTKNVYIPYTYENSEYTLTYNSFNQYYGNNENGVELRDINSNYYTLTIIPLPYNATVEINGVKRNTITLIENSIVSYKVYADGYETHEDTTTLTHDMVFDILLNAI